MTRPASSEYAPFYAGYVARVTESDVLEVLARQPDELRLLASQVPTRQEGYRYGAGKWSVRELFGHVADAERILGHRAFCISRGEQRPLPGFDESAYIANGGLDRITLAEVVDDFAAARDSNLRVLRRLDDRAWGRAGTANDASVSVRALAFIMAGHVRHHVAILRERYSVE